jgi:hypothetical protein
MKKDEHEGTCDTYEGEQRCMQGFGGRKQREREHLEDLDVDWRITYLNGTSRNITERMRTGVT